MNLHAIAAGAVAAVNPWQLIAIQASLPPVVGADGTPAPQYAPAVTIAAQVQPLDPGELRLMDALNIQGVLKKFYATGAYFSLVRDLQKGGDLVTLADGSVWLTVNTPESWPDWTAAVIRRQDGS